MKSAILLTVLSLATASSTLFAQPRFSVQIGIGRSAPEYYEQAPEPVYSEYDSEPQYDYQPPCPGPGYAWTSGNWYPSGGRRMWRAGFWAPPVYRGYSNGPRYYSRSYSASYPRAGYEGRYRNNFNGYDRGYDRSSGRSYGQSYSRGHDRGHDRGDDRGDDRDHHDNSRGEHRR